MINRRHFSLAASAAALHSFSAVQAQQSNRIVLGQSAAFTGPAAQLGIQFHAGAKLWFDRVNDKGGVFGRRIELKALDDGYEPARCAANTRRFIEEGVFALFGYTGTSTCMAALPAVKASQIPFIAPCTGAMALREPYIKNVFLLRASYNDETALIAKQLINVGMSDVAVFYQNDAYGQAGLAGIRLALNQLNLRPVAIATAEPNTVDVDAAVKALLAAKPDAVVQISAYKSSAAFIRAARRAGFGGTFHNVSFVGTQALADELGKDGAGVMVSQVVPSPYSSKKPIAREFVESIKDAETPVQANFSSMEGYLAAKLFTEAMRRAGNESVIKRADLIRGFETMGNLSLGGFTAQISSTNHAASSFVELSMLTGDGRIKT
jgi:branched-chain amino acid transport system substrate-binding protein